jgi:hypothetical protein
VPLGLTLESKLRTRFRMIHPINTSYFPTQHSEAEHGSLWGKNRVFIYEYNEYWFIYTAKVWVPYQARPRTNYGGQSGSGAEFSPRLRFSSVSIIPPMVHNHLHLHVALTRKTNAQSQKTFHNQYSFGSRGTINRKALSCSPYSSKGYGIETRIKNSTWY